MTYLLRKQLKSKLNKRQHLVILYLILLYMYTWPGLIHVMYHLKVLKIFMSCIMCIFIICTYVATYVCTVPHVYRENVYAYITYRKGKYTTCIVHVHYTEILQVIHVCHMCSTYNIHTYTYIYMLHIQWYIHTCTHNIYM